MRPSGSSDGTAEVDSPAYAQLGPPLVGTWSLRARWTLHRTSHHNEAGSIPGLTQTFEPGRWTTWYRERNLLPGTPFLLSPRLEFDVAMNAFFSSTEMTMAAEMTCLGYARDVNAFLNFLELARGVSDWRDATEADHVAYLIWRRRDPLGPRVANATWNREVSGVDRFYRWQVAKGHVAKSPVPHRARHTRRESGYAAAPREVAATYSQAARQNDIRWLPPRSYRQWRDVGLRGYSRDGSPDPTFRGRFADRNALFANLMVRTGLRLAEQASLTVADLPEMTGGRKFYRFWLSPRVAKGGSARWIYVPASILRALNSYIEIDRRQVLEEARTRGPAQSLKDRPVLLDRTRIAWPTHESTPAKLSQLTPQERANLTVKGQDGLEPAALWLGEAGTPLAASTWKDIFRRANERCIRQGIELRAHPHMLRHTFAVVTLEQLQRGHIAAMTSQIAGQRTHYARIFGDPLDWLRRQLGHKSVTTTQIYLHALEELEMETRMALVPETWDVPTFAGTSEDDSDERDGW